MRIWIIIIGLALGPAVSNGFARFGYGLILPAMRTDLEWSYTVAGWINTANALGYLIGALLALSFSSTLSSARQFRYGMILTIVALALSGFTENFLTLAILRLLAGIGGAPVFIAGGAMVATTFSSHPGRNAFAIALYFGGAGFGIFITAVSLPLLLDTWGAAAWPYAWVALGVMSAVSLVPSWWASLQFSDNPNKERAAFKFPPWKTMIASLAGYFLFAAGYIVYITFLVAWMHENGEGVFAITATWALLGLAVMLSPWPWRRLLAAYSNGIPLALATIATGIGAMFPLGVPGHAGLFLSATIFGLSFFIVPTAMTTFVKKNMPQPQWTAAMALYTTTFAVGQTLGPIGAGWLADTTTLSIGLAVGATVLFLGGIIAFFQKPLTPA